MMIPEWASWSQLFIGAATCIATVAAVRQSNKDLGEKVGTIDTRNREDHREMFKQISEERKEREQAIKEIQNNYVTFKTCELILHGGPKSNSRVSAGGM